MPRPVRERVSNYPLSNMNNINLKSIWQQGGAVINGWCAIPSSWSAELMGRAGFDSVTLDLQHGLINYDTAIPMLQALSTTGTVPLARVPWNEPGIIMKMLDAGAQGIICPMINTREECERFVGACRYFPGGYRSFGPTRAGLINKDYYATANTSILTLAMIETETAINNLEEILSVPGLDAVYIGPADLAITLGSAPKTVYDAADIKLNTALDTIVAGCKKHGIVPGMHCAGATHAKAMIARGLQFTTLLSDSAYLSNAINSAVKEARGEAAPSVAKGPY